MRMRSLAIMKLVKIFFVSFRTFRLEQIVLVFFVEIFKLRMHQSGNTCVRAMQSVHSAVATKQNKTVINPFMLSMTWKLSAVSYASCHLRTFHTIFLGFRFDFAVSHILCLCILHRYIFFLDITRILRTVCQLSLFNLMTFAMILIWIFETQNNKSLAYFVFL